MGTKTKSSSLLGLANIECDGDMSQLAKQINISFQAVSDDMRPLTTEDYNSGLERQEPIPDRYIISVHEVTKSLSRINVRKAVGPDSIPNWLLRSCAASLAPPVCAIWNSSIRESYTPTIWKSGDVCPIPKVNPPTRVEKDLRPITLSPQLSKCLEFYPREWLLELYKDLMDPHQYGSLKGSSTALALVELTHEWIAAMEEPGAVLRILFLDFRKAFDRVDHHILLSKLREQNIPAFLVDWLASFLCNRKQRVKIGDITSDWSHMKAGVPQGTLLGPICFLIHINDLKTVVHDIKYVDDSSLWEKCQRSGKDSQLQEATNQALEWTDKNNMMINTDKTKYMEIYYGRTPLTLHPITIKENKIEEVPVFKLLGLMINNKITWHDHVEFMCGKASRRIYFLVLLKRAGKSSTDIIDTYMAIIRSVLEYVCIVWHPGLNKQQSDQIEHIQKRSLGIAHPDLSYHDVLTATKLDTLWARRESMCKTFYENIQNEDHKLHYLLPPPREYVSLRKFRKYEPPKSKNERVKRSVINYGLFKFQ